MMPVANAIARWADVDEPVDQTVLAEQVDRLDAEVDELARDYVLCGAARATLLRTSHDRLVVVVEREVIR